MKKFKPFLLLSIVLFVGCAGGHQERVNTISDAMHTFNSAYLEAENLAISLHESGALTGDAWSRAVDIRNQAAPIVIKLNENWKLIPETDASVEAFISSPDFQRAVELGLQLAKVAAANHVEVKLQSLVRQP